MEDKNQQFRTWVRTDWRSADDAWALDPVSALVEGFLQFGKRKRLPARSFLSAEI